MEQTRDRNALVAQLTKMPHGKLTAYLPAVLPVARQDPELLAHLLVWNLAHSQVRDVRVAFPVIALRNEARHPEFTENALATLASLGPRDLLRAVRFNQELRENNLPLVTNAGLSLQETVEKYLRAREAKRGWFDRAAVSQRQALKTLYRWYHIKPSEYAQRILFTREYPRDSVFAAIRDMRQMSPQETAAAILNHGIPMQVAIGAASAIKSNAVALALLETMTAAELDNNMALLKRLGVMNDPALRVSYLAARERTKGDKKANALKAHVAAQQVSEDDELAKSLVKISEERLKTKTIDGSWAVLADASQSMQQAIELGRQVAALISARVSGAVDLLYFNTDVRAFDVKGMGYDDIARLTKYVTASGATCPGVGMQWLWMNRRNVDGVVIVTDGGENRKPSIIEAYQQYGNVMRTQPTMYELYIKTNEPDTTGQLLARSGLPFTRFNITGADYYSLPSVIDMLRVNKYSLLDEIMTTQLLTLDMVLGGKS